MNPLRAALLVLLPVAIAWSAPPRADGAGVLLIDAERLPLAQVTAPPRAALCGEGADQWRCGRIAALAFEQRLQRNAPRCEASQASGAASCSAGGEDLSLWLLQAGWARALAGAPATYHAAESESRAARRGIWRDGVGDWRVDADADPGCDVCAARHQRVTQSAD